MNFDQFKACPVQIALNIIGKKKLQDQERNFEKPEDP